MVRATDIIDIAGDRYTIKPQTGKTINSRTTIRALNTQGIQTIDKFQEIYGDNDNKYDNDNKEDIKLIYKYFKYRYDEQKPNIEHADKDKLIRILTTGLNYYKHQVDNIEKLNKLKNSSSSVRDYIIIKKYNSIAELIHNITTATITEPNIEPPIDDQQLYTILVHTAWYLSHPKYKRPRSLNTFITDIDNTPMTIQDIVNGIKQLKDMNASNKPTNHNTTRKKYSNYIAPFDYMSTNDTYTQGITKMRNNTIKGKSINGGNNARHLNILIPFIYLHRYLTPLAN